MQERIENKAVNRVNTSNGPDQLVMILKIRKKI